MRVSRYDVQNRTAVITMNNPPVNGLGQDLRSDLIEGINRAMADTAIDAVVLIGTPQAFSGGADIREFGTPKMLAEPNLHTVIATIERAPKPVVAAISGACMGGGLELALGCHGRVALGNAMIALPEVRLGLLPGAGGTQRLPRVVKIETALNMIVTGAIVPAQRMAGGALFDAVVDSDLLQHALTRAAQLAAGPRPLPRVRDRAVDDPKAMEKIEAARAQVFNNASPLPAPMKCIDAIAAAVSMPFDKGLAVELSAFAALVRTPESRALRHAFFGERTATKIADVPADTPLREIRSAAVIGAGTMGGGIAMNFANAGIPVKILELQQDALERGLAVIRKNYERALTRGKLTQDKLDARMALIQPTLDYAEIGDADIVIEAVFEDMDVKKTVFEALDRVMKPGAILATNTSTLDVNRIAAFTRRPQDVIGTHFFSPANVMRLLEVVRGEKTAKDVLATVMQLATRIRKLPVVAGVCDGFIGNRMIHRYSAQALQLLAEGALPQQVDVALERWGMAMGPFRMSDLAGNDVSWYVRKRHYAEHPEMPRSVIADRLCEAGRYGQKTGKGWYRYESGDRKAHPDAEVEQLIVEYRKEAGITPRAISDNEIVERLIYALVNEGARILEEGIAQRASDIDMVYLNGYGFPSHRGGPMLYADMMRLPKVAQRMLEFAAMPGADAAFWTPAPLLQRLADEGRNFN
ncbi:3-hydroxyacyl-CoA dehydrogenase [Sinimarinibacterium sp. CAU 1509]|uniref:3-hydroxyacyl-CoA dehydrogenase NAD-binding domain-containing protein n=1 Tax=Sinimarinibacterium sp. CAU 1509 TaxID=2562283 RepID=UPI0010ABCE9E|nr:3-hydroxyacyl-CoA dehydrogenase NAD-binding domain-containing protein [Sinimarinibacterium sp. CAU 1509]TJY59771.1 3-hydroxyacyl-CoA dehydrogenase [Sinimarinibacterium sp. CAU 1509]